MKLFIDTVGCQMNMLDSELVVGALRRQGLALTTNPKDADVILFNTCSVRQHAEDKIYSALGKLREHKRRNPDKIIGVLGCMAQKDQELVRHRAPHVDLVCGPGQLAQVPALIEQVRKSREPVLAVSLGRADASRPEVTESFESYDPLRESSVRPSPYQAFVRTQFGCDKFCTYCIVPSVRGPEQGRHPEEIRAEVAQLIDQGVKEITLVGQTVNSYRFTHGDGRVTKFADLLALLHDVPGLCRLKFVTNFPKDMTDDVLQAVRDLPRLCKYLHVPAQHGDNEVLKRMKRLYTIEFYLEMLDRCREIIPGVAVSSDFIVGFCGETEEAFERTMELVRIASFKNSFIFKYSPRPGTKAHELFEDDVPEETKKRRNNDLLVEQNRASLADHRRLIGQTVEILVEGPSKRELASVGRQPDVRSSDDHIQLTGRTMTDHIVVFDGPRHLAGSLLNVRVEDASSFTLYGRPVGELPAAARPPREEPSEGRIGLPLVA